LPWDASARAQTIERVIAGLKLVAASPSQNDGWFELNFDSKLYALAASLALPPQPKAQELNIDATSVKEQKPLEVDWDTSVSLDTSEAFPMGRARSENRGKRGWLRVPPLAHNNNLALRQAAAPDSAHVDNNRAASQVIIFLLCFRTMQNTDPDSTP
jgi:hypothetical protein